MMIDARLLRDRLVALCDQHAHGAAYRRGVRDALLMLEELEALTAEVEGQRPAHDHRARVAEMMDRAQLFSLRD